MTKPAAKPTRVEKRQARADKREQRRQTFANIKQAFVLTRRQDSRFLPYLIGAVVLAAAIVYVVVFFVAGRFIAIPFAVLAAILAGMLTFSRRAQHSIFSQAEGQPGAAGWILSQRLRGDWRLEQGIAGTAQLDAVHRLIGRPGVVLVGEGAQQRVRGLIAQEKKKIARVAGDTPIYDVIVGTEDGDIQLARLNRYLLKLPTNLSKEEVSALNRRMSALGGPRAPLPQGPLPQGARLRNVQRTVRRRS